MPTSWIHIGATSLPWRTITRPIWTSLLYTSALFEELVKQIQIQGNAAGIAVAFVDGAGKTQYEQYFGYRDTAQKLPMDENTIFGLASVTKSFVALSIMQLAERGLLDLDDPCLLYTSRCV